MTQAEQTASEATAQLHTYKDASTYATLELKVSHCMVNEHSVVLHMIPPVSPSTTPCVGSIPMSDGPVDHIARPDGSVMHTR